MTHHCLNLFVRMLQRKLEWVQFYCKFDSYLMDPSFSNLLLCVLLLNSAILRHDGQPWCRNVLQYTSQFSPSFISCMVQFLRSKLITTTFNGWSYYIRLLRLCVGVRICNRFSLWFVTSLESKTWSPSFRLVSYFFSAHWIWIMPSGGSLEYIS